MSKTYDPSLIAKMCEAFGVERVSEVTRVVLDIRAGQPPMLYVERIADAAKIVAALQGPLIDVHREEFGETRPHFNGNVSGTNIAWNNGSVTQRS